MNSKKINKIFVVMLGIVLVTTSVVAAGNGTPQKGVDVTEQPILKTMEKSPDTMYPTVVYVDDDFNYTTPGYAIDHFSGIQQGIDAVAEYGTIYVAEGIYSAYSFSININKTLSLIGENKNDIEVRARIHLYADSINIMGLTITLFSLDVYSNNTRIMDLILSGTNHGSGLIIHEGYSNNIISQNLITNHYWGITLGSGCMNNQIYHNDFLNNTHNARDEGNNIWAAGYPSGGNYWDDYNGVDENHDGFGDTPYLISGGDNQDHYPSMYPYTLPPLLVVVDDDFDASNPFWGTHHFDNIQDAYDAVYEQGTILVLSGTYNTNTLVIHKTINFVGESPETTIIHMYSGHSNPAMWVYADDVTIRGFTLHYAGSGNYMISLHSDNNIISNNIFSLTELGSITGITLNGGECDYTLIKDNTFIGRNEDSIGILLLFGTTFNTIYHNNFINCSVESWGDNHDSIWNIGYPSGGNYWSMYQGPDEYRGPNQNIPGNDGFIDLPYVYESSPNNIVQDNYPFTMPNGWLHSLILFGDLDYDSDVDLSDLAQLLAHYGMASGATYEQGDIDSDGDVDLSDLAVLLGNYGLTT